MQGANILMSEIDIMIIQAQRSIMGAFNAAMRSLAYMQGETRRVEASYTVKLSREWVVLRVIYPFTARNGPTHHVILPCVY